MNLTGMNIGCCERRNSTFTSTFSPPVAWRSHDTSLFGTVFGRYPADRLRYEALKRQLAKQGLARYGRLCVQRARWWRRSLREHYKTPPMWPRADDEGETVHLRSGVPANKALHLTGPA